MVRWSVEDMYIIYTDMELEDTWKNMELPADRITDRDVRHLVTLADTECYEQYHDRDEDVRGRGAGFPRNYANTSLGFARRDTVK